MTAVLEEDLLLEAVEEEVLGDAGKLDVWVPDQKMEDR